MAQYIDKDDLVAEIEKRIKSINSCPFRTAELGSEKLDEGQLNAYDVMLSFINTLESKDVDLKKEIDSVWNPHFNLGWDDNSLVSINHKSFESIAQHFFKLGLKVQKGE